jgi:hypothetical protein
MEVLHRRGSDEFSLNFALMWSILVHSLSHMPSTSVKPGTCAHNRTVLETGQMRLPSPRR